MPDSSGRTACVMFDLYGTLVDLRVDEDSPALWHGLAAALVRLGGRASADDVRHRFQHVLRDEGRRGGEGFLMEPAFRRLAASTGARGDVGYLGRTFRELSILELAVRPYVAPLFHALRQSGCRYGLVSNTEAVLTGFDLDRCPILKSAQAIVLSSEVGVRKPDPTIFQIALQQLQATAAETVMVGNSMTDDIAGARRAGLRAVFLDLYATEVGVVTDGDDSVVRAAPTLDALREALTRFGWQPERRRATPEVLR